MVKIFEGIPYAQPPIGPLRWKPPVKAAPWTNTKQATAYSSQCPQSSKKSPELNEDCLYLNVYAPDSAASSSKLPVMVFIHGGAFVGGSASDALYTSPYLAALNNIILVTMNYRLGALGFLVYDDKITGNFGILDQQLALQWVRDNISQFGGDPSRVTIFGESAGAMSVGIHLTSAPGSQSLFQAGIMESNPYSLPYKTSTDAKDLGKSFVRNVKCELSLDPMDCLMKADVQTILTAQDSVRTEMFKNLPHGLKDILPWTPVIDGNVVTTEPMVAVENGALTTPVIIGVNHDEGVLFAAILKNAMDGTVLCPVYKGFVKLMFPKNSDSILALPRYACSGLTTDAYMSFSNLITDYAFVCGNYHVGSNAKGNLYGYFFTYVSSFNVTGVSECSGYACHGSELPYVFRTTGATGAQFTSQESTLAATVGSLWGNFATNLNPDSNGSTLPSWPAFTFNQSVLTITANPSSSAVAPSIVATTNNCAFWDTIGYNYTGR